MKKNISRIICLALTLLTLSSLFVSSFALSDPYYVYDDVSETVTWEYDDKSDVLIGNGKTYSRFEIPEGYIVEFLDRYNYDDPPRFFNMYNFYGYARESELICADYRTYYVSEQGRSSVSSLTEDGEGTIGFVLKGYHESDEELILAAIGSAEEEAELDVTLLRSDEYVYIGLFDPTMHVVYRQKGGFFKSEGVFWYIDFDALDNSYFDANGNFSFRSGTVAAKALSPEASASVSEALANPERSYGVEIEERNLASEQKSVRNTVYVLTAIFGVVLPGIFTVLFICRAVSQKEKAGWRYLIPAAIGFIWIVLSFINLFVNVA